jgi:hypothetical protein
MMALPTSDGTWLYYSTSRPGPIRRIRTDGRDDSEVVSLPVDGYECAVTAAGLYFVVTSGPGRDYYSLQMLHFATGKVSELLKLDFYPGNGLSVSADDHYVLLTKPDQNGTDLMLVENFR